MVIAGCQVIGQVNKIGKWGIATPKNRFSSKKKKKKKKKDKNRIFLKKIIFSTFIHVTGSQAVKRVKKSFQHDMDKKILMPSEARLKKIKELFSHKIMVIQD